MALSFKLIDIVDIYWFSKEPICFINSYQVEFKDGEIALWNKYLHREDGPAVEYKDGQKYWYWNGDFLEDVNSQEEFERWKRFRNFQ